MVSYSKPVPVSFTQTYDESCWAAVLESWSLSDTRLAIDPSKMGVPPSVQTSVIEEDSLCDAWGEGSTRKITPTKLDKIAYACSLRWKVLSSPSDTGQLLEDYIVAHLGRSYLFCAYTLRPDELHSVLIYRIHDGGASYMDPGDGGYYWCNFTWFHNRRKLIMMRRQQ